MRSRLLRSAAPVRSLHVAAIVGCALVATPATASGATLSAVPIGADVVSEVPAQIAISGVADVPGTLSVGWGVVGEGCYSRLVADQVLDGLPVTGAFSLQQPGIVDRPGPHLLCAFLEDGRGTVMAASVVPVTARAPRSDFVVSAPRVVALGRTFAVRVSGTSEAPRSVFGKLAPPGAACAEALSSGLSFLTLHADVSFLERTERVRLDQYGLWRACVRTERFWTALDPSDASSEVPIRVTVRCTAASRELSRARDRWRAMSRRLRLRGLPPSPHLRIRGMAVRRARAWVERACAPGA